MKRSRPCSALRLVFCAVFLPSVGFSSIDLHYRLVGPNSFPGTFVPVVAPTSAGNVGAVFDPASGQMKPVQSDAPEASRLVLAQSSIGAAIVASPSGGASSSEDYLKYFAGDKYQPKWAATNQPAYAKFNDGLADAASPWIKEKTGGDGKWTVKNIRFPGAVELGSGDKWNGTPAEQSFYLAEYDNALDFLRSAIAAFPSDDAPRIAALKALDSIMQGYIAAGNNALYWAARKRFTLWQSSEANQAEREMLEAAQGLFAAASDRFASFIATFTVDESTAFNAGRPWSAVSEKDSLQAKIGGTLGVFARALDLEEDVLSTRARLLYYDNYGDPVLKPDDFQGAVQKNVAAVISPRVNRLRFMLATAGLFSGHPDYLAAGFAAVASSADALTADLEQTMPAGRVRFAGKSLLFQDKDSGAPIPTVADQLSTLLPESDKFFVVGEYSPEFMPLIGPEGKTSTAHLIEQAQGSITRAVNSEDDAKMALIALLEDKKTVQNRLNDAYTVSWNELAQLTGTIKKGDPLNPGQIVDVPDVEGAIAGTAQSGKIKTQLQAVDLAYREYEAAVADLELAAKAIDISLEANAAVVANLLNLAVFQNGIGTELAGLETQRGAAQADAARARAHIQAEQERKRARASIIGDVAKFGAVVAVAVVCAPAGAGLAAGLVAARGAAPGLAMGLSEGAARFDEARAIEAMGEVDANLAVEIAKLNKLGVELQTSEKVEMTNVNAANTEIMAFAEIKKMNLDLTRKRLNVLLAEQKANIQRTELANLYARASYLQGELNRSIQRAITANNPQWGSEYWLGTAAAVADAEKTYLWAQEWSYLAAKSLQYYILPLSSTTAGSKAGDVLRCRTVKALDRQVGMGTGPNSVPTLYNNLLALRNRSDTAKVFRLRDNYLQGNPARDKDGKLALAGAVIDPATGEGANNPLASDRDWMAFLKDCLFDDQGNKNPAGNILRIRFSTNLNKWASDQSTDGTDGIDNPFYDSREVGLLIDSATGRGVRANIRTSNLALARGITATLQMRGTSTFRIADASKAGAIPFRSWSILPAKQNFQADIDGNKAGTVASVFREYSPANDLWILEIRPSGSTSNQILINAVKNYDTTSVDSELPAPIQDIELSFDTQARLL